VTGLLRGVKVVEAAVLLVGDYLGMLLGDEGADVIKLEQPGIGDYLRKILGQFAPDNSPMHVMVNRNKRSLTLDPRSAEGADVFRRLIEQTDVFVTGHVGDVPAKLGMDYDSLRAIKPDIVYCQATGFGAEGPYATIPTHGAMMEKLGGSPTLVLGHEGRVVEVEEGLPASGVILGPLFGAYAIAAALVKRDRTGEGSYIDISCSDAVVASAWPKATGLLNEDKLQPSDDVATFPKGGLPCAAKYTYYQTSDEKYVLFCCIEKKFWDNFCVAAGRPDLCGWHSNLTVVDYGEDDFELMDELQRLFHTKTQAEWIEMFKTEDIPAGPALTIAEARDDPHLQAREIIVNERHPVIGDLRVIGNPIRVRGETFDVERHAPRLAEHTDEILAELGYSPGDVDQLRTARVV
jgi:crotonobetainyl-CoA:carnitine CoA-transferase CaiB-like acyl-CoA transferase